MICITESRLPIVRRGDGYFIRWYYNGWHYWLFYPGKINFVTEGEKYRTLGTQTLTIGSGQITQEQCDSIRTIMNATEISVYTDSGWGVVRVDPGSWIVYDHGIKHYEAEITVVIGSKYISRTGFSPAISVPVLPPSVYIPTCGTITIGNQTWMTCNYDINFPGSKVYDNDEANRSKYGGLYTHSQVLSPGFCPYGWHVPTEEEWDELIDFVGDLTDAGGELKEIGTVNWLAPNTGATDDHGFKALPGGFYFLGFNDVGESGYFWTTKTSSYLFVTGQAVLMKNDSAGITKHQLAGGYYCPVRLIADVIIMSAPIATAASNIGNNAFVANWNSVPTATEYYLDVATDIGFTSLVPGYSNLNVGNVLTYSITGLNPATNYYYRVRSYGSGFTSVNSNTITTATYAAMLITSRGTGAGVARLSITVSSNTTLKLSGTAKFYSDAAGTLNESDTATVLSGALRTLYLKCPSGTANLLFTDVTKLSTFGLVYNSSTSNPAWHYDTTAPSTLPNVPSLNCANWYFPNCTNIGATSTFSTILTMSLAITAYSPALTQFSVNTAGTLTGTLANIPDTCTIFGGLQANTVSGNISDLPAGMIDFSLTGSNTITGSIANLPANIERFIVSGSNTISGNISALPSTVENFNITGSNTITGDIADFPNTIQFVNVQGSNTISGNLSDFPASCTSFTLYGSNTVTGGFASLPAGLTTLVVFGSNTINGTLGDLPASINQIYVGGSNTVSGSLADMVCTPSSMLFTAANTISGTINDITADCTLFTCHGNNTISGDLGDLGANCISFDLQGQNTVTGYTSKAWTTYNGYTVKLIPVGAGGLSSAEIDQLLIDLDTDCAFTNANYKTITLTGTNAAPTATSLAARNSLIAKGVALLTN